jgi:putative hydrolase
VDLERPGDGDDPFEHLPPELREMLEQLAGPGGLDAVREQVRQLFESGIDPSMLGGLGTAGGLGGLLGGMGTPPSGTGFGFGFQPVSGQAAPTGPVDWTLATRVALQLAAEGDRSPSQEEVDRVTQAFALAEHWLDATPLPAPPDAGRTAVSSRQEWVNAAITAFRPLVEPVAKAATDGLIAISRDQLGRLAEEGPEALEELTELGGLPPGFADMLGQLLGSDPGELLRPAGVALAGLQAGQIIGQLATQLLGQYDLGLPTAPRGHAYALAVNIADTFEGYDLDPTEVAVTLALHEAAHRRLYHAVPWLEAHIASLVARFAAGTTVDESRLREIADELLHGVDPDDPEALRSAMERAADFRLTPTDEQRRVLERLQGVVGLVGAWARHEVARASDGRLPSLPRVEEVLRRRRAVRGDSDDLLAALLGLDLLPDDEVVGERFVAAVEAAIGPAGLHRALAHPENLPDAEELSDPPRWLARTAEDLDVPDDLGAMFEGLGDAPHEASAAERTTASTGPDDGGTDDGGTDDGGTDGGGTDGGGTDDGGDDADDGGPPSPRQG